MWNYNVVRYQSYKCEQHLGFYFLLASHVLLFKLCKLMFTCSQWWSSTFWGLCAISFINLKGWQKTPWTMITETTINNNTDSSYLPTDSAHLQIYFVHRKTFLILKGFIGPFISKQLLFFLNKTLLLDYVYQLKRDWWYIMYVIHCIFPVNYERDSTLRELQRSEGRTETAVPWKSGMTTVLLKAIVHCKLVLFLCTILIPTWQWRNQDSKFIDTSIINLHLPTTVIVIQSTMKRYVKGQQYMRNILLSQIKCSKPIDQFQCCDVCNDVDCHVWDLICEG